MQVKCRCCGEKVDRDFAYNVVVNGKNTYYCSKKEYYDMLKQKQIAEKLKNDTYSLINDIFGYEVKNTALYKEINEILAIADYQKIFDYLSENKQFFEQVMVKSFNHEYAKIRYFSAIIKNNIRDYHAFVKDEPIKPQQEVKVDTYESKYVPKKRRCLNDYG